MLGSWVDKNNSHSSHTKYNWISPKKSTFPKEWQFLYKMLFRTFWYFGGLQTARGHVKNITKPQVTFTLVEQVEQEKVTFILTPFQKSRTRYHNQRWLGRSGVSCGWRWDILCQQMAYAEIALPGPMAGRPWAMAELMRRALRWHRTSRRHLQETDEPNQAFLLFLNRWSTLQEVT